MSKKIKSVEFESVQALSYFSELGDVDYSDFGMVDGVSDTFDLEKLIHFLSTEETSVVLLRYLGYNGGEIVKILGLKNIGIYYAINRQIRMHIYLFNVLYKDRDYII